MQSQQEFFEATGYFPPGPDYDVWMVQNTFGVATVEREAFMTMVLAMLEIMETSNGAEQFWAELDPPVKPSVLEATLRLVLRGSMLGKYDDVTRHLMNAKTGNLVTAYREFAAGS